jgi:hypothetical protein
MNFNWRSLWNVRQGLSADPKEGRRTLLVVLRLECRDAAQEGQLDDA